MLKAFIADESGATAIEYALIAALISTVIVGVVTTMSGQMSDMFNYISTSFTSAVASS
ncbi:Flp family type IVb pilin [Maritalea sp. S77]|uniref:Flp family type IVb pilin n=1 Tax=Maritalea sp. S77 TaxID=3415125 RepID=UPI003C7C719F